MVVQSLSRSADSAAFLVRILDVIAGFNMKEINEIYKCKG